MNKNILKGVVLVAVLGGLGWYAINHPVQNHGSSATTSVATVPNGPYKETAKYYDISASYATSTSLSGDLNAAATKKMYGFIKDTITQFKKDGNFANLTPEDIKMQFASGQKYTLDIRYLIASSPHTQSFIYTIYEDTGGAHGNIAFKTFTFDTKTGALLSLSDLFNANSNYLGTLSTLSRQMIPALTGDLSDNTFITEGTKPEAQNFQNFFFDNSNLDILFPPYQVAPYAAGPITLQLKTSQLQGILKSSYP